MIFKGVDNQFVEFKVLNYQFPEITDCEYDSNWLLIYLKVNSHCGDWESVDASLLVSELMDLTEWFENLVNNKEMISNSLSFIEPNLRFELIENSKDLKTVRMSFDLESRPPNADDSKDYFIDFKFNNTELIKIIEELKSELKRFPLRAAYK